MKKALALLLAAVMLFGLVACSSSTDTTTDTGSGTTDTGSTTTDTGSDAGTDTGSDSASGDTFHLASYLQLSGVNSVAGISAMNGIDLAIKYINDNGGVNGQTITIDHYDTTGSTEEAVKIVQRILNSDVDAVLGSVNSNEVAACIPYLNEAGIYNFGLGTGASWMEDDSMIYTFRASCNNNRTVPADVDMIEELGYETIAVMNSTDDSAKTTADTFVAECEARGLTILTQQQCDQEDTDFSGQIAQLLAANADVIFMSLQGNTFGPFTKQLRNAGYTGMIASAQAMSNDQLEIAGLAPNTNYIFVAYPYVTYNSIEECTIPIVTEFLERYYDAYGEMPQHESAYRGWDTMMVLWEASKIAGSNDSEALREATNQVVIDGLGGTLDYTNGDREGYAAFNGFIKMDNVDLLFSDWLADGGYEAYLEATGNEK